MSLPEIENAGHDVYCLWTVASIYIEHILISQNKYIFRAPLCNDPIALSSEVGVAQSIKISHEGSRIYTTLAKERVFNCTASKDISTASGQTYMQTLNP